MSNPVIDTLLKQVSPRRPFISFVDGTRITFGDFEAMICRKAAALAARGVGPGDRVAVQLKKRIDVLVLYLATIRAGGIFLPLNTAYTPAEIEYLVGDAEPTLLVCESAMQAELRPVAEAAGVELETVGDEGPNSLGAGLDRPADSGEFTAVSRGENDVAAILYTSGTTGRPKGAMLSHGNLVSNALTLAELWAFTDDDVLLHALPVYHTHGLFVAVNTVLASSASMIFLPRFDAHEVLSLMPRATVLMGVPTFYTRLLNEPGLDASSTKHMRLFISGSAPLSPEIHRAFRDRTGHTILERYGMTETCMNTSNPYEGERRAGTVGVPLPGIEVRVTDPSNGTPLPQGEVGILEVRGPNVFLGYWNMPEKTESEFREDGFFITGDMGFIDEGGYVTIVGRDKDLIISGGLNVYPKEVENEIDALPEVVESAVIGVPHTDFGEAVVAVVVPHSPSANSEACVIEQLGGRLARYKQPKKVVFVDALPRNAMGKIQKNVLRERYKDLCSQEKRGRRD